nr:hypothetical protein [uncultured bacterium]
MQNEWTCKVEDKDGAAHFVFSGAITEGADLRSLVGRAKERVVIDLLDVQRINSIGVREWIEFIGRLCAAARDVSLEHCSVAMVHQFNMITGMRGAAEVRSVMLPYLCNSCGREETTLLKVDQPKPAIPPTRKCPGCPGTMEFDDLPEAYLGFLSARR